MEFLARLFGTTKPQPTEAERRAAAVLSDAEMLLTDVLVAAGPWPIPEGFSDRGRAILERIDTERSGLRDAVKARREQAEAAQQSRRRPLASDAEAERLKALIIAQGGVEIDRERAAAYARAKLIDLGVEVEPAE